MGTHSRVLSQHSAECEPCTMNVPVTRGTKSGAELTRRTWTDIWGGIIANSTRQMFLTVSALEGKAMVVSSQSRTILTTVIFPYVTRKTAESALLSSKLQNLRYITSGPPQKFDESTSFSVQWSVKRRMNVRAHKDSCPNWNKCFQARLD